MIHIFADSSTAIRTLPENKSTYDRPNNLDPDDTAMKILIDHNSPFLLAHGGVQVQIEQTKTALEKQGVEVEYIRWWDEHQKGDLIHFFGVPSVTYQNLGRKKGLPILCTALLSETCNRPIVKLAAQAFITRFLLALPFGNNIKNQLTWKSYRNSDGIIVGLEAEKMILQKVYNVPDDRVHIVPLGCMDAFLDAEPSPRTGDYLICASTITRQKRSIDLARIAIAAEVPILFVGRPYSESDPYWHEFCEVAASSPFVRYQGHISDRIEMIRLLQAARGFTLFSRFENWSIAADEAVACGLPVLLPDQRWVHERFGTKARTFAGGNFSKNVAILRRFFAEASSIPPAPKPRSWDDVALRLSDIYRATLARR